MKRRQLLQGLGLLPIITLFRSSLKAEKAPTEVAAQTTSIITQTRTDGVNFKVNGPLQDLTFSSFLVYRESEVAHAIAFKICYLKDYSQSSPFVISGACGNGTTHLAHATANEILSRNPSLRVHIVSAEKFLNQCIQSIRRQEMQAFRTFYRESIDVLVVDSFQYIQRGQAVQEEMIHTLKELHQRGCLVILATDTNIDGLVDLHKDMANILKGGVAVNISLPNVNSRKAMVHYFAEKFNVALSANEISKIAKQHKFVRAIEGQVKKIKLTKELGVYHETT